MDLEIILERGSQKLNSSKPPNPLYGQNIFFYKGCVGPIVQRNQMIGYLGAFLGFYQLSNEIDICVLPINSVKKLLQQKRGPIINDLLDKLQPKNKEDNRPKVLHSSKLFLSEKKLFSYIKQNLLGKDTIREQQFSRINFSYELN